MQGVQREAIEAKIEAASPRSNATVAEAVKVGLPRAHPPRAQLPVVLTVCGPVLIHYRTRGVARALPVPSLNSHNTAHSLAAKERYPNQSTPWRTLRQA